MKNLSNVFLLLFICSLFNCTKSAGNDNGASKIAPTGLDVTAVISTDGSGNATFTATATNAVSFDYDFGNGFSQLATSGSAVYKYPAEGTYTVKVTAKSSGGLTATKAIQVIISFTPKTLAVVWSEEFNVDGAPDPAVWGYDTGGNGWGNHELEYYTNRTDNVLVSGGTLKIMAKREDYMGSSFTSARLLSLNKFSFKYGKLEIKAKLPAGVGTWPAIWVMGDDIATNSWPACGEIDIMEHRGKELNKIFGTVHYPNHSGANSIGGTTVISNATTEFHRYAIDWSAASVKFMVDDITYFTFANDGSLPFNHKFFIILNIAMGGDFAGSVDSSINNATMEIDYIRLYK